MILKVNSVVQDMTYIRSFESQGPFFPLALNTISPKVLLLAPPFVFPSSHSHGTVRQNTYHCVVYDQQTGVDTTLEAMQ